MLCKYRLKEKRRPLTRGGGQRNSPKKETLYQIITCKPLSMFSSYSWLLNSAANSVAPAFFQVQRQRPQCVLLRTQCQEGAWRGVGGAVQWSQGGRQPL